MFIEPQSKKGWLEVICGSMFSGKTEELIRRLKRAIIANQRVMIFKPQFDKRYDDTAIVSHNANKIHAVPVSDAASILTHLGFSSENGSFVTKLDVVGIDEAQFFDNGLPQVCETLANHGIRVIIAGLDMDYEGKPFGTMPYLLAMADFITKLHAICQQCGDLATHSYRKTVSKAQFLLGEKDAYEPRCRKCYRTVGD